MHMVRYILFIAIVITASCGNPASVKQTSDSTADTVAVAIDSAPGDTIPTEGIAFKMGGDTIAPKDKSQIFYSFDNRLLKKDGKKLSAKEARKRFWPMDTACDAEVIYKFQRYFELDSLKKRGQTPQSDMGQMIVGEITLLDTIKKSPSGTWILWSLRYESERACPFSYGTFFMISTYNAAGKNISTQCMSREEGGADAPLTWSTVQTCNIFQDGSYRALFCDSVGDVTDDSNTEYSSIVRKTFTGVISDGGKITRKELEIERNE
jgi:hypothetical protein